MLSWSVGFTSLSVGVLLRLLVGTVMLLVGAMMLSLVVAAIFVLTPNAISYEGLLLVPVFVVSGIMFTSTEPPSWIDVLSRLLPLRVPFNMLLGRTVTTWDALGWAVAVLVWLALATRLGRRALHLATRVGTLEVL